jgi:hypothetical protein
LPIKLIGRGRQQRTPTVSLDETKDVPQGESPAESTEFD